MSISVRFSAGMRALIFSVLVCFTVGSRANFSDRPRLQTVNGHLFIYGGKDKNLTFVTTNNGYVNVNGENLFSIVQNAKIAASLIKSLKYTALSRLEDDMKTVTLTLEHYSQRLNACETFLTSAARPKDKAYSPAVTLLRARVVKLERRVRRISRNLLRNECRRDPCLNGGTCLDRYLGYECRCPDGWEGKKCEKDVNECAKFAGTDLGCQNGATCYNTKGSYQCHCAPGWYGIHCLKRSNDCSSASAEELCGHGVCVSQPNDPRGYTCICSQGWKTDGVGLACTVDVDECVTSPCSRNPAVLCHNAPGTFFCGPCPTGFSGNGFQCSDVDECQIENGGCSVQPMVACINTFGSSTCGSCPPGYSGDGRTCVFVGKCQVDNGGCHPKARCSETGSNVQCQCVPGYTGYGIGPFGCQALSGPVSANPCEPNPCRFGGRCHATSDKSFRCACLPGFAGETCSVVNSCDSNPCMNGGTCEQTGSLFRCKCAPQFSGSFCEDRKEECGEYLRGDVGVLRFPAANSTVSGRMNCAWVIQVNATRVISITFERFQLRTSFECQLEWVEVHDGRSTNDVTVGRYCGGNPPGNASMVMSQNSVYIWMSLTGTAKGSNFQMKWSAVEPACGGAVNATVHGVITSPGYPGKYPNRRDCYWEVSAPIGKRIMFTVFELRLKSSGSCSGDFLEIHEGTSVDSPLLAKFCNASSPEIIETPGNTAYLYFHSDSKGNDRGFQIAYHPKPGHPGCGGIFTSLRGEIVPPTRNGLYLPNMDCGWIIRLPEERRIKIEFVRLSIQNSRSCRDDFLEVRDGGDMTSPLLGKYCGSALPPPITSNHRTLFIRFYTDEVFERAGFKIKYKSVCDETFTGPWGVIKSPGYPNSYKNEEECVLIIEQPAGKIINLEFQQFEIESTYRCIFDYVEIRDGHDSDSPLIGKYCGSNRPGRIVSTHNYLYLKMVTDNNVEMAGFYGNYSTVDVSCGGIHTAPSGVIASPIEEGRYPSNSYCRWVISLPRGQLIQLTFTKFKVESFKDCASDYVAVYDNSTDLKGNNLIGRYCNYDLPPVLTSSSNVLTVVFKSDSSITDEGFEISYTSVNGSSSCGGKFFTEWGIVKTPNYPDPYPNGLSCTWIIRVKNGHKIHLNVSDFALERPFVFGVKNCKFDYLEIRDGGYPTSPLIGRYCGKAIPRQILSQTNSLHLKFVSDDLDSGSGFQIFWDGSVKGCGGTLTGPSGSIISPNYPERYGSVVNCIYRISVAHGSKIQLTFIDLELEAASRCKKEYIEILDGPDLQSKSLGKFCTLFSVSSNIISSGNHLTVAFRSGLNSAGKGYYLKYFTVCRTNVTGYGGAIESPNFPDDFPSSLDCLWSIKAPLGNKIALSFTDMNFRASCRNTYIEISEGDPQTGISDNLKRYCEFNKTTNVESSEEWIHIRLVTSDRTHSGNFRLEWAVKGCGGYLTKPAGTFTSPNYPNFYPTNTRCEWWITVDPLKSITIVLSDFNFEKSGDCYYDGVQVYGGPDATSPLLTNICTTRKDSVVVTSSGNSMYVVFKSDSSNIGRGFRAAYRSVASSCGGAFTAPTGSIHSRNYPNNYQLDDCIWYINVDDNHRVNLTFLSFDVTGSANCSAASVEVFDGSSIRYPSLLRHCGNKLPENRTIVSSRNWLTVRMKVSNATYTAKGFLASYETICGGEIDADVSGVIESGFHLSSHMAAGVCTWLISTSEPDGHVILTLNLLSLGDPDQICIGDQLLVYDGPDANSTLVGTYCSATSPLPIVSHGNQLFVKYVGGLSFNSFFQATYTSASSACGGDLYSHSGVFASPNYPESYPADTECIWTINSAPGNKIQLSFKVFDIGTADFCNDEYLEIRDRDGKGKLLGVYCGSELPSNLTAHNSLWVKFKSKTGGSGSMRFLADYSLVYGNEINGTSGEIASPGYPRYYGSSNPVTWRITVTFKAHVLIEIDDFFVEADEIGDCSRSLTVYDGFDETAPILLKKCDAAIPVTPFTSSSNVVYMVLNSQSYNAGCKFLLKWRETVASAAVPVIPTSTPVAGCGGEYNLSHEGNSSVAITVPGVTSAMPIKCSWKISCAEEEHLSVTAKSLVLNNLASCESSKIEISTNLAGKWKELIKICGTNGMNGTIHGHSVLLITYQDSWASGSSPATFTVQRECGGSVRKTNGVISFDYRKFPSIVTVQRSIPIRKYPCQWDVEVTPGRTIRTTFQEFDGLKSKDGICENNFFSLRNGGNEDSPYLGAGVYCSLTGIVPRTTSNKLFIKVMARYPFYGFTLTYEEVPHECGDEFTLSDDMNSTVITSPNYPNIPPIKVECVWTFVATGVRRLQVDFLDRFDLVQSNGCKTEYVSIRDGGTDLSHELGRFCAEKPNSIKSTGNMIYIKYYTNASDPQNGFKARVSLDRCGGILTSSSGVIISPGYPNSYPFHTRCRWEIETNSRSTLKIKFLDVDLPRNFSSSDLLQKGVSDVAVANLIGTLPSGTSEFNQANGTYCTSGAKITVSEPVPRAASQTSGWSYVPLVDVLRVFRKQSDTVLGVICSGGTNETLTTSTNKAIIEFDSGSWDVDHYFATPRGFKLKFTSDSGGCWHSLYTDSGVIETPEKPAGHMGYYNCQWRISVSRGRRISVRVVEPAVPAYFTGVLLFAYNDHAYRSRIGSLLPKPFILDETSYPVVKSTSNLMTIDFVAPYSAQNKKFKLVYDSDEPAVCGGNIGDSSGRLESPKNLSSFYCPWYFTRKSGENETLAVTVYDSVIGNRTGTCTSEFGNFLSLQTMGLRLNNLVVLCGNVSSRTIRIPLTRTVLTAVKGPSYSGEMDFKVKYKTSKCGGIVTGTEFAITSPNYPDNYPDDVDCAWLLNVPFDSAVKMTFELIEFDVKSDCRDYLTIKNGANTESPTIDKFCGVLVESKPIISETSNVFVEFHSDDSNSARGFRIRVEAVNSACGGFVHDQSTEITSPHFPKPYGNNEECEWEIRSSAGTHIGLVFEDRFHIEESADCRRDYLEVFDYVDGLWKSVKKLCGREFPAPVNSTSDRMKIVFHSNENVTSDGFKARWFKNCGATYVNQRSGRIVSPGYPGKYLSDLRCEYIVKYPGMDIDFNFTRFHLEKGFQGSCTYDSVEFFSVNWRNEPVSEGKYCGSTLPSPRSMYEEARIVFSTDTYSNYNGFELNFFVYACGGVVSQPTEITVNLSRANYMRQNSCKWNITAPEDKVVVLRFTKIQLPTSKNCEDSALKVSQTDSFDDGTNPLTLATLCGNVYGKLPVITSSTNRVVLELHNIMYYVDQGFGVVVSFSYGRNKGCGGPVTVRSDPVFIRSPDVDGDGNYEGLMDCTWKILAEPYHFISADFLHLNVDNCNGTQADRPGGNCSCDFVEIRDGIKADSDVLETLCGRSVADRVVSSRNSMTLRFVTDATINSDGFAVRLSSEISECGLGFLNVTENVQTLTSPNFPDKYPLGLRCKWRLFDLNGSNEKIINLHLVEWDLEDGDSLTFSVSNGGDRTATDETYKLNQTDYVIGKKNYFGFFSAMFNNDRTVTGKGKLLDYYAKSNEITVDLVSRGTSSGKGFKLEYSIAGCTRNYSAEYGQIVVYDKEGGPACDIVIAAPTANHTISLYFNTLNLYHSSLDCSKSYVEARDGLADGAPLLRKFCGYLRPRPIYSSGRYLRLKVFFASDASFFGFEEIFDLTYTTTDAGKGCGGKVASMMGVIFSPEYPSNVRRRTQCRWQIVLPQGMELLLKFKNFDVGPANTCETDFVKISDVGADGSETERSTFCGGSNPAVIRTESDVAVTYVTSVHNGGTGWELEYRVVVPGAKSVW